MHQSFTDTLVKWFIDNFPMFVDSFIVLSVHCVARGLAASFLYKTSVPHRAVVPCDSTAFLFIISRTQEADHVAAGELTRKHSIIIRPRSRRRKPPQAAVVSLSCKPPYKFLSRAG